MKKFAVMVLAVMLAGVLCVASFADMEICPDCHGAGKVKCVVCHGGGLCAICHGRGITGYTNVYTGSGRSEKIICSACNGNGKCWECDGFKTTICINCFGKGFVPTY